jgi:hypothetical protein
MRKNKEEKLRTKQKKRRIGAEHDGNCRLGLRHADVALIEEL